MNEGERARVLDGLYNHLLGAMHARYVHQRSHAPSMTCRRCADLELRLFDAKTAYDLEIKAWLG